MKIFTGFAMKVEGFMAVVSYWGEDSMMGPVYHVRIEDFDGNELYHVFVPTNTSVQEFKLVVINKIILAVKNDNLNLKLKLASL